MLATALGKDAALAALQQRRAANAGRTPTDNVAFPAGAPMFLPCDTCGEDIVHPEDYLVRQRWCAECAALHAVGWLA